MIVWLGMYFRRLPRTSLPYIPSALCIRKLSILFFLFSQFFLRMLRMELGHCWNRTLPTATQNRHQLQRNRQLGSDNDKHPRFPAIMAFE